MYLRSAKTNLHLAKHCILKLSLGVFCTLLFFFQSAGQSFLSEVGFGVGASIYQGDLSPHWIGAYNRPGPSFQLMANKNLFPGFTLRANYAFASISDNEENYNGGVHKLRNFSFEATINEFSAQLIVNPQFNNGSEERGTFQPYFFGGVGLSFASIKRDFSRFNRDYPHWQSWVLPGLSQDSMTQLPTTFVTLPVGVGIRYQIGDNLALYGEATKRIARTEYLDGFSKSANRRENDGYSSIVIGLIFRLSSFNSDWGRYDCPKDIY
jgi:hypothetical protein